MKIENKVANKVEIILADNDTGFMIKNMYPLYLHDLAGIHGTLPNKYGIYEEEDIRDLQGQYDCQQMWFEKPGVLFPYLIKVDGRAAGFCLIGSGIYVPKEVDYYVYETFLMRPFRGQDVMEQVVPQIFDLHHGKWMLYTHSTENNKRAQHFWERTLANYTGGAFTQEDRIIDEMPKRVYQFSN